MTPDTLALLIVIALFLLWKLDFVATLLTLKNLKPELPGEFADVWDEEKYAQSQAYERAGAKFSIVSSVVSLTALLAFWFAGGFGALDDWARSFGFGAIATGLLFMGSLFLLSTLLSLPFDIYHTFVLEEKFGFNKTTPATFASDQLKSLLLTALLGLPLLALILWLFLTLDYAWVYAWIAVTALSLLLTFLAPSLILPLFNKFTPMEDGELKSAINAMAEKCDFPLAGLYVIDGSKRSTKSNAYFTGFGKTKKIALYDTLIESQSTEELVGVLAHEIGHFKKKHIIQRILLSVVQTALIFFLLGLVTSPDSPFTRTLFEAFRVDQISYHVGLVIFFILFKPVSRLINIGLSLLSRKHEFEADHYAATAQGSPEPLVTALKKLSRNNLANLTPHPLEVFLHHSHPPILERIKALRS
ncbi:M48 family metallopeptidase [Roseibacillus ishigakijimensis]|uniref:M48 family metallopeptidase n=1 Tax=Roseibacillus ishigakijimensis TaxID=454146 RepID=A0A934RRH4_9BACT|nr:M48 family metallopeptidase [Roseibacillus ishigakijimensis]MBK1834296.1 M48 family metallopeptidase [Roseibacillus ishigakijimensis]